LRQAFDRSFAEAPRGAVNDSEALLAIRLGADPYALRLSEITGVYADKCVSPLPSAVRELLGVAAFRGVILPVYDLRSLLGYAAAPAQRWMMVAAKRPVAFAFDAVDGHERVARGAIATAAEGHNEHVRDVVRGRHFRPIIWLTSVLAAVERRAQPVHTRGAPGAWLDSGPSDRN